MICNVHCAGKCMPCYPLLFTTKTVNKVMKVQNDVCEKWKEGVRKSEIRGEWREIINEELWKSCAFL